MNELEQLLALRTKGLPKWVKGRIPHHYKRITVDPDEAVDLAKRGAKAIYQAFHDRVYFTQALIAGGMLSKKYKDFTFCTSSQYGKSWIFARVAILLAYKGHNVFVAGARKDTADIIMGHVYEALQKANGDIRRALIGDSKDQIDRLNKSLSKAKISFANGGCVQPITFGDTYGGLQMNSAIGRGGDYIVDEAALVSDEALAEIGRADFAKIGERMITAMISNPHNPGLFYSKLAEEACPEDRLVIWADALTAVEEERFDVRTVLNGTFSKHKTTLRRYLLCELDMNGDSMFDTPKVVDKIETNDDTFYFLGVDAAYKGKDNICVALVAVTPDGHVHAQEIEVLDKSHWIDGVTEREIVRQIANVAKGCNCSLVCVDQGWGVWLIYGLLDHGVNAKGIAFQSRPTRARVTAKQYAAVEAYNMRAEMHLDLQNLIEDQTFDITKQAYEKIEDTLPFIRADRKANGTIQVRDKSRIKESIGRSPDELDALLLAIHAAIVFFGESNTFTQ